VKVEPVAKVETLVNTLIAVIAEVLLYKPTFALVARLVTLLR
jgi:hypothetical protein